MVLFSFEKKNHKCAWSHSSQMKVFSFMRSLNRIVAWKESGQQYSSNFHYSLSVKWDNVFYYYLTFLLIIVAIRSLRHRSSRIFIYWEYSDVFSILQTYYGHSAQMAHNGICLFLYNNQKQPHSFFRLSVWQWLLSFQMHYLVRKCNKILEHTQ